MDPSIQYTQDQSPTTTTQVAEMKRVPFRSALGSLMYLAIGTRPDIAFAVSTLAQFADKPGWTHFGTSGAGLVGYTDADGASQEHRRAITGFAFLVDGGAISWGSRKQEAAKEAQWLRRFIGEVFRPLQHPTTQAYRYSIPLHSFLRRERLDRTIILPDGEHGRRHANEGPSER